MQVKYKDWIGQDTTIELKAITEILNNEEITGIIDLLKRDPENGAQVLSTLFMSSFKDPEDFQYLVMSEKPEVVDEVGIKWLEASLAEVMKNNTTLKLKKFQKSQKKEETNGSWVVALASFICVIGTFLLTAGGIAVLFSEITNPLGWILTGVFGFASVTVVGYIIKEVIKNLTLENK